MKSRQITFCLCPDMPAFGLVSALEVLRHANRLSGREYYRWSFLSEQDDGVVGSNGLQLRPTRPVEQAGNTDMAFVIAGFEAWHLELPRLARWLGSQAQQGATLGGISNGSFVLAELKLLDGYTATVHWEDFSSFYESYNQVNARYQRFVVDRKRMSCSGGGTTLDMFLEIVRGDLGEDIARKVSRQMLLEGSTPQGNALGYPVGAGSTDTARYSPLVRRVLGLLDADISGRVTVSTLADRVGLSRRELLRMMRRETGETPSSIIAKRRLERAHSLIQNTRLPLADVADAVGYSSQSHLTMRYRQRFGKTPAEHRRGKQA